MNEKKSLETLLKSCQTPIDYVFVAWMVSDFYSPWCQVLAGLSHDLAKIQNFAFQLQSNTNDCYRETSLKMWNYVLISTYMPFLCQAQDILRSDKGYSNLSPKV